MDYSNIIHIINDLNLKGGDDPIDYKLRVDNIEDLLDRFKEPAFNEDEEDEEFIKDTEEEDEDFIVETDEPVLEVVGEDEETFGTDNIEEVHRENEEIKKVAFEAKKHIKQELEEEKQTINEEPESIYKDINDLITRYKDVL